jgi:hypothetical protein
VRGKKRGRSGEISKKEKAGKCINGEEIIEVEWGFCRRIGFFMGENEKRKTLRLRRYRIFHPNPF